MAMASNTTEASASRASAKASSQRRQSLPKGRLAMLYWIGMVYLMMLFTSSTFVTASPQISQGTSTQPTSPVHHLLARAPEKTQYVCNWGDVINGSNTTPLIITIGLSVGGIAGIIISIFTFYQAGRNSRQTQMMM